MRRWCYEQQDSAHMKLSDQLSYMAFSMQKDSSVLCRTDSITSGHTSRRFKALSLLGKTASLIRSNTKIPVWQIGLFQKAGVICDRTALLVVIMSMIRPVKFRENLTLVYDMMNLSNEVRRCRSMSWYGLWHSMRPAKPGN